LLYREQLDPLMANQSSGVFDASEHVIALEPGVTGEDGVDVVPGCEHSENVLHREPMTAHDGLAAEDPGIDGDA
jgi:hypothetical protein